MPLQPNSSFSNNYSMPSPRTSFTNEDIGKIADNSFGDSDAEESDDALDGFDDPNYVPPDKQYIDVLKEYFGHAKFRP